MTEMDVGQLAALMRARVKNRRHRAALIVGFEGGSVLLNHASPKQFLEKLYATRPSDLPASWPSSLRDGDARREHMIEHTRGRPDAAAMSCIAGLVRGGYVHAIVATDNAEQFRNSLTDRGVSMAHFVCTESLPDVLKTKGSGALPLFIDGGELLLYGCQPDGYEHDDTHSRPMLEALETYLDGFNTVYCWGWCPLNQQLDWIFKNQAGQLKVLGWYETTQDVLRIRNSFDIVQCPKSAKVATTHILQELGAKLFDTDSAPATTGIPNTSNTPNTHRSSAPLGQTALRPLLSDDVLNQLVSKVQRHPFSYFGIDGDLTRRLCCDWLSAQLQRRGHDVVVRNDSDISVLGSLATTMTGLDNNTWFLGRLNSGGTLPDHAWLNKLLTYCALWAKRHEASGSRPGKLGPRIVLFLPAHAAHELQGKLPQDEEATWIRSVYAHSPLDQKPVVRFVHATAGPTIAELAPDKALELTETMIEKCLSDTEAPFDRLHDSMSVWRRLLLNETAARAAQAENADAPALMTYDDLLRLWEDAVHRMANGQVDLDFPINPVHRREEDDPPESEDGPPDNGDDPPDFDLGPATPRPRP